VKLTQRGRRLYGEIERRALEWERQFLQGIKLTELNQLDRILSRLEANLDRLAAGD